MSPVPPKVVLTRSRSAQQQHLIALEWALSLHDPFPPAKTDAEIADLVAQMGAELVDVDATTRRRRLAGRGRAVATSTSTSTPSPSRSRAGSSGVPWRAAGVPRPLPTGRATGPQSVAPPPVPSWARPDNTRIG